MYKIIPTYSPRGSKEYEREFNIHMIEDEDNSHILSFDDLESLKKHKEYLLECNTIIIGNNNYSIEGTADAIKNGNICVHLYVIDPKDLSKINTEDLINRFKSI